MKTCSRHPKYQAKRAPTSECGQCWSIWHAQPTPLSQHVDRVLRQEAEFRQDTKRLNWLSAHPTSISFSLCGRACRLWWSPGKMEPRSEFIQASGLPDEYPLRKAIDLAMERKT